MSSGRVIMVKFKKGFAGFRRNISTISEIEDSISDTPITEFGSWWW